MFPSKNTTIILQQLRFLMLSLEINLKDPLSAYIVASGDAHQSTRMADCDQRRAFVSGFDGSAGTAIITQEKALLWTDARYFIQAGEQLDDNWTLMKEGIDQTQDEWLRTNFPAGAIIGVDAMFYSKLNWDRMQNVLSNTGQVLTHIEINLIDRIWKDRPECLKDPVKELLIDFTGQNLSEKLTNVRFEMKINAVEVLLVSQLDEVAWLLNLRGTDLPLAPVFNSYVIITRISNRLEIFIDMAKISEEIRNKLKLQVGDGEIQFYPYESVSERLHYYSISTTEGKIWISKYCNALLANSVPKNIRVMKLTPISLLKAIKNPTEVEGMKKAHIRDSAVIVLFLDWLETEMANDIFLTEIFAANKLQTFREIQENFVSLSFKTISASGPNGAIVHYWPTNDTDRPLSKDELYLLDSGGHYLDGTTDITRTMHFGTPTNYQKDCFSRVLKGHIAVATAIFPNNSVGNNLDSLGRQALWHKGRDYGHGTGHGIGAYLNVGEGPQSITFEHNPDDPGLKEDMFMSNEPGYYEEGQFGIRLENIVRVVKANFEGFLKLETISWVPIQKKLIKLGLLTSNEIDWINNYHTNCREIISSFIEKLGYGDSALEWLKKATDPI